MRDIRVGVVEDDPASCQRVLDHLNQYRSETGTELASVFDDGEQIVEKYTPMYDILFLDIEMQHMDGMAAARRIRERDNTVVIVFIAAPRSTRSTGTKCRRSPICSSRCRTSHSARS